MMLAYVVIAAARFTQQLYATNHPHLIQLQHASSSRFGGSFSAACN
jgi:hypothetical protein